MTFEKNIPTDIKVKDFECFIVFLTLHFERRQTLQGDYIMNEEQSEGLRSRKKRQTRLAIERAALELFIERDYDEVTIEDICKRADVSRKTFFNYFPSKLSVTTGYVEPPPDRVQLLAYLEEHSNENYLDVIVNLIEEDPPPNIDPEIRRLRTEVLERMPNVFLQQRQYTTDSVNIFISALCSHLEKHPDLRIRKELSVKDEVIEALSVIICIIQTRTSHDSERTGDNKTPSVAESRQSLACYFSSSPK